MSRRSKMTKEEKDERRRAKRAALVALGLASPPRTASPYSMSLSYDQRRLVDLFFRHGYYYAPPLDIARMSIAFDLEPPSIPRCLTTLIKRELVAFHQGDDRYGRGWYLTNKGLKARRMRSNWYAPVWAGAPVRIAFNEFDT